MDRVTLLLQQLARVHREGNLQQEFLLLNDLGQTLLSLQDIAAARAAYEQAINIAHALEQRQDEIRTMSKLAMVHMATDEAQEALVVYERALALVRQDGIADLVPILADLYRGRADAYFALAKYQKAITDYDQAIAFNAQEVVSYARRGDALAHQGRYEEAIISYDMAIRLTPDNAGYEIQKQLIVKRVQLENNPAFATPAKDPEQQQWDILQKQFEDGAIITARVIDYNKSGLIVDVGGLHGYVPLSQLIKLNREETVAQREGQESVGKYQSMLDQELQLKITEINRLQKRLILSERQALQEWRLRRREALLNELKPGEVRRGVVSNIANFGAFIDLGGADGLVHISQLAWTHIVHPSEVLHIGQEVEVMVLAVDKEKKKIALSIRRAAPDPWVVAGERYLPGQIVTGVVTKIAPFGVFVRIDDGLEGVIHLSEFPSGIVPEDLLNEGAPLQVRILRIDVARRRLGLSLRLNGS